jgi:hypothetical protein
MMTLPRQFGNDAVSVLSHAGDSVVEATWPRYDVYAEFCW